MVMAPDEMSCTGCHEDPIILSFENCTIGFEMFATVVQTISDDNLHTELAYNQKCKDTTDQLGQYPPVRISLSLLIPNALVWEQNAMLTISETASPLSFKGFRDSKY